MKRFYSIAVATLAFTGCSQHPPHHLPESAYYRQQETDVLLAVSGHIMTHQFFVAPITQKDTINLHDSLAFPHPLPQREISRVLYEHKLTPEFAELLRDTVNWSQSRYSVVSFPISELAKVTPFTPRYILSGRKSYPCYWLSRVSFNPDFTKAYFQLTWADQAGGVRQYVFCQRDNGKWIAAIVDSWNSFKM